MIRELGVEGPLQHPQNIRSRNPIGVGDIGVTRSRSSKNSFLAAAEGFVTPLKRFSY